MDEYTTPLVFSETALAVVAGKKDVTRRLMDRAHGKNALRWKPGRKAKIYAKSPRSGAQPIGEAVIVSIQEEFLQDILKKPEEVVREGFDGTPEEFVRMWLRINNTRLTADEKNPAVRRIEFKVTKLNGKKVNP